MENKLVSVIITTHNRAPSVVLRAVNCALSQTYDNTECIVVDDSTSVFPLRDEVEKAVLQASGKIEYIKHETNMGACAARNTGLAISKGYYVAFLDDDDEWFPEKIEEQVKGFTSDDIALVYCDTRIINDSGSVILTSHKNHESGYVFDSLLEQNFIGSTSNPLIKKECIEAVGGFDTEMQARQDYDLWLRIAMLYPVQYIDLPLFIYHTHDQERISNDTEKQIAGERRLQEKYKEQLQNNKKAKYMRWCSFIPLYIRKGWKSKAFSIWIQCVQESPTSIRNNTKHLLHIVLGYEFSLFRLYHKICESTFLKER